MSQRLLTTEEVAEIMRVDVKTVRALVEAARLRVVRLGKRCVRFDPRDVEACIEGAKEWASIEKAGSGTTTFKSGASTSSATPARLNTSQIQRLCGSPLGYQRLYFRNQRENGGARVPTKSRHSPEVGSLCVHGATFD